KQRREEKLVAPRRAASCLLCAGQQGRSEPGSKSLHPGRKTSRWNASRPRVAGRSGWRNAADVIAAQARAKQGPSKGNALGVKNCSAVPTTLAVRTGEVK